MVSGFFYWPAFGVIADFIPYIIAFGDFGIFGLSPFNFNGDLVGDDGSNAFLVKTGSSNRFGGA